MGKRTTRNQDEAVVSTASKKTKLSSGDDKTKAMDGKILKVMLQFHIEERWDAKVDDVANELGVQVRTKSFRQRWSVLKSEKKFIGPSKNGTGDALTKAGLDEAATPEYKEMMKELAIKPKTNQEHQERLKKHAKQPKFGLLFDFLLEYGSLTNAQLSALAGVNQRSHQYAYALQELRKKVVEVDGTGKPKKFRLSDKAFLRKEDRPRDHAIDQNKLFKAIAEGRLRILSRRKKKNAAGDETKATVDPKKEPSTKNEKEEGDGTGSKGTSEAGSVNQDKKRELKEEQDPEEEEPDPPSSENESDETSTKNIVVKAGE